MPQLLVDFITSLDGYGAAEGWAGFWGLQGPEYLAWLEDQPEADYTVLMGANTYRLMSGLWPRRARQGPRTWLECRRSSSPPASRSRSRGRTPGSSVRIASKPSQR